MKLPSTIDESLKCHLWVLLGVLNTAYNPALHSWAQTPEKLVCITTQRLWPFIIPFCHLPGNSSLGRGCYNSLWKFKCPDLQTDFGVWCNLLTQGEGQNRSPAEVKGHVTKNCCSSVQERCHIPTCWLSLELCPRSQVLASCGTNL